MTRRRFARSGGFSLTEVMVAILLVAFLFLPLFLQTSSSQRSGMDSYVGILAHELAQEPIEVFRAFGYRWASTYGRTHTVPGYALESWQDIPDPGPGLVDRPAEASGFRRRISLTPVADPPRGIRIEVRVAPRGAGVLAAWLTQDEVSLETVLFERPR